MQPSEHRRYLNEVLLPKWAAQFSPDQLVYDIGKSTTWDYRPYFKCQYMTVDRNEDLKPDLVRDVEKIRLVPQADGILFNGVFEQCDDPLAIIRNLRHSLKEGGRILCGLAGIGMVEYGPKDRWRITQAGVQIYMREFKINEVFSFHSYYYVDASI